MNDDLQSILRDMIRSGPRSNPAMTTLIHDYARYHWVLVVVGGLLVIVFALLSVVWWTKFARTPKTDRRKWGFERQVYLAFGILSGGVALLIALIVIANATNALDPVHGFSLLVDSFTGPMGGASDVAVRQAFSDWITSGSNTVPSLVEQQIHDRIAFHATKALVSGVLLVAFAAFSALFWGGLIQRHRASESTWKLKEVPFLVSGMASVTLSLLMMVFVVANMQGACAPITPALISLYH